MGYIKINQELEDINIETLQDLLTLINRELKRRDSENSERTKKLVERVEELTTLADRLNTEIVSLLKETNGRN